MHRAGKEGTVTRRGFLGATLAAAAASAFPCGVEAGVKVGERPESLTLLDLARKPVILPDAYRDQVVVVHFWATWCPYCQEEMEALEALFAQYRGRGFAPVSVNVGETRTAIDGALGNRRVSYPILLDAESAAVKLYGVTGIPTTFILDRGGTVRFKVLGKVEEKSLRRMVAGLL